MGPLRVTLKRYRGVKYIAIDEVNPMLDPAEPKPLDLTNLNGYIATCLEMAGERLGEYGSIAEVAQDEDELNRYPRLENLSDPKDIFVVDDKSIVSADLDQAADAILNGGVLLEHTCAGEATRLGLGTKYLVNPRLDLGPMVLTKLLGEDVEPQVSPDSLRSITLGRRHMLQLAWDISKLAEKYGKDPAQALAKQTLLVIVNEGTYQRIIEDFVQAGFYGFSRNRVLFMVQKSFHGITLKNGKWVYDVNSARRLHNHGQMLLQTTMDNQVFRLDASDRPHYLTWSEYRMVLGEFDDKVSFNIEDLDYLSQSLDLTGLAAALKLSGSGARMVMEVVANNPEKPQKGGLLAWDETLGENVMIESFQLAGMPNEQITYLNKNINHYPRPAFAITIAREEGLSMPVAVKNGSLYFQPVQGDVNFLVETAFVRRAEMKPISAWKSGPNTDDALVAMAQQENRPGFMEWASQLTGRSLD